MKKVLVGSALLAAAGASMAQVSAAFTNSVTAVTADIATYGAALIGVAAVGIGFAIGIKYVKKIRGAA